MPPKLLTMKRTVLAITMCLFCFSSLFLGAQDQELKSDSLDVLNYTINLNEINFSTFTIDACTQIEITAKQDGITALPFDLLQLEIASITIDGSNVADYSYNDTLLIIPLASPINIDDTLDVEVCYSGNPQIESYGWGGFHFNSNYAYNLGVGFAADPHNYGRVWFPCFDEFHDRATYDIFATIPEDKTVVCGGEKVNEINNGNGTKTVHWNLDKSIPTYLASIAVDDYVQLTQDYYGIQDTFPLDMYVRQNNVEDAEASFINLPQIVEAFEYYFGAYPWNRVGFVSTDIGSMEHATNIAYSRSAINGNLNYEWLIAHELSHMWFGDKVTCASGWDMWMNEGWAVFCESVYKEYVYGKDAYDEYQREKQIDVIRSCHTADGGYYPIYGLSHDLTYGETVYQKGGCIVHTMRGYMGDDLFFPTVRAYLEEYAYDYATTEDMKNFFSDFSGIDMTDFFDGWVYAEGFPHFSVDSFIVEQNGTNYNVDVYMRQKLNHAPEFYNSNRVPVTLMSNNWEHFTDTLYFSGQTGMNSFEVPFQPDFILVDLDNAMIDAVTDDAQVINATGEHIFTNTYFRIDVQDISDSVFIHAQHNWVAPDTMKTYTEGLVFSDRRYYRVEGTFPDDFTAKGLFYYNFGLFDQSISTTILDSLTLLYRRDATQDWIELDYTRDGTASFGFIITDNLMPGEYTIALWEPNEGVNDLKRSAKKEDFIKIFPNPSDNTFNFAFNNTERVLPLENLMLKIYDPTSRLIEEIEVGNSNGTIRWAPQSKASGVYYVNLISNNQVLQTEKIIYKK